MRSPVKLKELRHEALLKGVSLVIILSLLVAVVVPSFLGAGLYIALGAGLSYVASAFLFDLSV